MALAAVATVLMPASAALALPPGNDNFGSATVITSLPFSDSVDITEATTEPDEPQFCSFSQQTVWYSITPAADAVLRAETTGSIFETLNVYESVGAGFGGLNILGCATPGGGNSVAFSVRAGTTYFLQAGFGGSGGTLRLNLQAIPAPPNNDFANATPIAALPFTDTVDTGAATIEPDEPRFCSLSPQTVWYSFTPATDIVVRVDTSGSSIPFTDFALYKALGPGFGGLSVISCPFDHVSLHFNAKAGTTYYLQAGNTFFGRSGLMQVNVEEVPPPTNDDFGNAATKIGRAHV